MSQTCATCRFWKPDYIIEPHPSETGDCHRQSPQVYVVHDEISLNHESYDGKSIAWKIRSGWPETAHSEWCGEWQSAPPPDAEPAPDNGPKTEPGQ